MPSTAASLSIPDLAGKALLVTGASTGIGAALVRPLLGKARGRDALQCRAARPPWPCPLRSNQAWRRGGPGAGRLSAFRRCDASAVEDAASELRPARRPGQQCWRHARPCGTYSEMTDDHYDPRHGPRCALGDHRDAALRIRG